MGDAININAARRNIRRDKNIGLTILKGREYALPLALAFVAMERARGKSCGGQFFNNSICAVFRAREDQDAVIIKRLQ